MRFDLADDLAGLLDLGLFGLGDRQRGVERLPGGGLALVEILQPGGVGA